MMKRLLLTLVLSSVMSVQSSSVLADPAGDAVAAGVSAASSAGCSAPPGPPPHVVRRPRAADRLASCRLATVVFRRARAGRPGFAGPDAVRHHVGRAQSRACSQRRAGPQSRRAAKRWARPQSRRAAKCRARPQSRGEAEGRRRPQSRRGARAASQVGAPSVGGGPLGSRWHRRPIGGRTVSSPACVGSLSPVCSLGGLLGTVLRSPLTRRSDPLSSHSAGRCRLPAGPPPRRTDEERIVPPTARPPGS